MTCSPSPPPPPLPSHQKPICTICYEDLKPTVEDLQCVPLCGHVFHELCLQQWLEYCPVAKKPACPFCKQSFDRRCATRLYFQSTDAAAAAPAAFCYSPGKSSAGDVYLLTEEARRLELKISSLSSGVEKQRAHIEELRNEASSWKELAKREEAKIEEMKKEKLRAEHLLRVREEELAKKSSECTKLQERNMELAKELAALKLTTDLNLEEDEIVKLASLGHGINHEKALDVMKRSLALRNKTYKELMVRCNMLGRAETRTRQNLDKAEEKIKKLKVRVQELGKASEERENEMLRQMKVSKRHKAEGLNLDFSNQNLKLLACDAKLSQENQTNKIPQVKADLNKASSTTYKRFSCVVSNYDSLSNACNQTPTDLEHDFFSLVDEDAFGHSSNFYDHQYPLSECKALPKLHKNIHVQKHPSREQEQTVSFSPEIQVGKSCTYTENGEPNHIDAHVKTRQIGSSTWSKDVLLIDDITRKAPLAIRENQAYDAAADPGTSSLLSAFGPDGATRNVRKWCRQVPTGQSLSLDGHVSKSNGELIAVGADGRGGKIKVLTSLDQLDHKAQNLGPKKLKYVANRGCQFQIEHFFGKAKQ